MMANVRAERLLKIPAEPSPELRIPGAAAQTRVVSRVGIRLGSWESVRAFKGIICDDISEFEPSHASHAVRSLQGMSSLQTMCEILEPLRACEIAATKSDNGMWRSPLISFRLFQNASSRLTLVLWPRTLSSADGAEPM